jgi:hypothetical protein
VFSDVSINLEEKPAFSIARVGSNTFRERARTAILGRKNKGWLKEQTNDSDVSEREFVALKLNIPYWFTLKPNRNLLTLNYPSFISLRITATLMENLRNFCYLEDKRQDIIKGVVQPASSSQCHRPSDNAIFVWVQSLAMNAIRTILSEG